MSPVPLVTSTGAGSEMRRAMGLAVFSGMIGVTAFGLFLTPIFYVLLRSFVTRNDDKPPVDDQAEVETSDADLVEAEVP